ncbi:MULTISPECIES: YicC/YloC family endoribonuclease [unclassified Petrotoga]|uniref:YicC/YloC family endoribonuclease n=2 Tax=Petrotoga TaxID=28236 RepID=UPI000EF16B3F|nr:MULTISPECIES: YicC/YloC family endoribonuclease [unclassified Petrotoga]
MRSMTGYGRLTKNIGDYSYNVEIKSLNSKNLNINTSISPLFSPLELHIQNLVKKYFKRGNLRISIDIKLLKTDDIIDVDLGLAKAYYNALNSLINELHLADDVNLEDLLKFKDIVKISIDEKTIDDIWEGAKEVLKEVIETVLKYQKEEGKDLKDFLDGYLTELEDIIIKIEENAQQMKEKYREQLKHNVNSLISNIDSIDENRLEMEIVLLAERADISEEMDRLKSHTRRFKNFLENENNNDSIGQELDFICQEMHRELNTIASKSKILDITNLSLEGRTLVNKIREQVQNLH